MKVMAKVKIRDNGSLMIWCPGCEDIHIINVPGMGPQWTFNGDAEKPTFQPSILVTHGPRVADRCHSYVVAGKIRFLNDSTHKLKGQTVDLPDVEEWYEDWMK